MPKTKAPEFVYVIHRLGDDKPAYATTLVGVLIYLGILTDGKDRKTTDGNNKYMAALMRLRRNPNGTSKYPGKGSFRRYTAVEWAQMQQKNEE